MVFVSSEHQAGRLLETEQAGVRPAGRLYAEVCTERGGATGSPSAGFMYKYAQPGAEPPAARRPGLCISMHRSTAG